MQLIKLKFFLIELLMCSFLYSCINANDYITSEHLIDEYYIYKRSDTDFLIECKLRSDSDRSFEGNIRKVLIEDKVMLIEMNENDYFLIISNREELRCGNNNFYFELSSISEVDSILKIHKIDRNDLDLEFENNK